MPVEPSQAAPAAANPVDMISAILDAEKITPATTPEPVTESQPAGDDYQPGNNAQTEGDEPPEERAAVAEIPLDQLEAIELETTYKGADGKDVVEKLPIKALREGYMRQQDYQRKTAEVARQREEVATAVRQGVESERAQYAQNLQHLQTVVMEAAAAELKNVDWNNLAETNQYEYIRLMNRKNQFEQTLQGIQAKQTEVSTKMQADSRQAAQATAQRTWAKLEADIPGWNNETYQATLKAAESVGISAQQASQWLDPGAIKLLHKAYLFDQLQAGKTLADKKVVSVPKVVKPGAAQPTTQARQSAESAKAQLRKTGRVDDLAAFLSKQM